MDNFCSSVHGNQEMTHKNKEERGGIAVCCGEPSRKISSKTNRPTDKDAPHKQQRGRRSQQQQGQESKNKENLIPIAFDQKKKRLKKNTMSVSVDQDGQWETIRLMEFFLPPSWTRRWRAHTVWRQKRKGICKDVVVLGKRFPCGVSQRVKAGSRDVMFFLSFLSPSIHPSTTTKRWGTYRVVFCVVVPFVAELPAGCWRKKAFVPRRRRKQPKKIQLAPRTWSWSAWPCPFFFVLLLLAVIAVVLAVIFAVVLRSCMWETSHRNGVFGKCSLFFGQSHFSTLFLPPCHHRVCAFAFLGRRGNTYIRVLEIYQSIRFFAAVPASPENQASTEKRVCSPLRRPLSLSHILWLSTNMVKDDSQKPVPAPRLHIVLFNIVTGRQS